MLLTECFFCWGTSQLRVFFWLLSLIEEVPYIHHDGESSKIMTKKVKKSWAYHHCVDRVFDKAPEGMYIY
jgi:hypothetical protein